MSLWRHIHEPCGHSHPESATGRLSCLTFLASLKAELIESRLLVCYLQNFSFAAFVLVEPPLWEAQQLKKRSKCVSENDEVQSLAFLLHPPDE